MASPKVTVLMSVYNGEKYLKEAIESILNQSFSDFEFLIFNDCSSDSSRDIILSYNDPRVVLIDNEKNIGLTKTLNKGITLAKGEYIARMDADDISHPERFMEQVKYLDKKTDVSVCGTWVQLLNEKEIVTLETEKNQIRVDLLCHSCLAHPSVMVRKSFFDRFSLRYNESLLYAQDYELWVKCSHNGTIENIDRPLLFYRRHGEQVSTQKKTLQKKSADTARLLQLSFLRITPTKNEEQLHLSIVQSKFEITDAFVQQAMQWIEKLLKANKESSAFPNLQFNMLMILFRKKILMNYYDHQNYDFNLLKSFFNSPNRPSDYLSLSYKIKFFLKCVFHFKSKKVLC